MTAPLAPLSEEALHGPVRPVDGYCQLCEIGEHECRCGEWLHHGTTRCGNCKRQAMTGVGW